MTRLVLAAVLLAATPASAADVVLRMGTVAPDGTAWARELKAFAREVAASSNGALTVKWYMGGIAGDDVQVAERVKRNQLDGIGSGGMLCERLSPLMRALHVAATTRDEAFYAMNRLKPAIDEEFRKAGYIFLGGAGLGPDVLFTREPVRSYADLARMRLWVWDLDEAVRLQMQTPIMGAHPVALPVAEAAPAYEDKRLDGFVALPAAALAFQWSAQSRYVTDLRLGFVSGCILLSERAYDLIPNEVRETFRAAAAKLQQRMEDLGRQQDDALLGGLFTHQGLTPLPPSEALRREFRDKSRAAQDALGDQLVPRAQLERVQKLMDEYHHERPR